MRLTSSAMEIEMANLYRLQLNNVCQAKQLGVAWFEWFRQKGIEVL
jgi:hypothetical protein